MPFGFKRTEIPEVVLVRPEVFGDDRGFFMETYKYTDFLEFGIEGCFLQDNQSTSAAKGTLRGLHYQKEPGAQAKLVRVIKGSIFDVAVDIRRDSPSFGKWVSVKLSAGNKEMLYIPKGFAHGYCTLEDNTEGIYKCSDVYSPELERGIIWNDPAIGINWPVDDPVLSDKDRALPSLEEAG